MSVIMSDPVAGLAPAGPEESWLGAWENSADPAYCRDLEGRVLAVNLSFARKFGRPVTAFVGAAIADFVHPDDAAALHSIVAELSHPHDRAVCEHRWLTPQGIRWFAWEKVALGTAGSPVIAIRAVGRDITRQRLAEEQFYRLSRAVEQSPVAIVITDLEGCAQYVNPKFTAVSGRSLEDLLDQQIEVLRDGHPDEASYQKFWQTVRNGEEWKGELATRRHEGGTVWESVKVSCMRGPTGEITNYLCLREDITERKKLEHELRQAQKLESLGTLAGGIAHDFNNLLAIINGYAEFCLQGAADAAVLQKSLREIRAAAHRASGLVRQILTFSRKAEIRFAPVDLNQLIRDLGTLLAETFPRTVTFHVDLQEALPALLADQNQLQQIILNLCVNARDAMPTGGTISLSTTLHPGDTLRGHQVEPGRNYACFRVSDTGTGMSPEVRARIFEPFFTTKQGTNGTGLGLAVVYGIVVGHHGFLEVDSTPGSGSTFSVFLPLADLQTKLPPAAVMDAEFPRGRESLLIVDDEDPLRSLLARSFTEKGYQTAMAANGHEAIDIISDLGRPFDAVLLDLNMPGAGGLQVMKVIRLCRPELKVLVVSGHITPEARADFHELGQRDFIQKPYTLGEIGLRVRKLLDYRPVETG